ncbi:protein kinase [Sorangium sp. So ce1036]|uniref:serine/threonine-protein kinase n=1 Tax=Sorangium sp. So ce1036 TaxID=3133328 RepID=UPI003F0428F9
MEAGEVVDGRFEIEAHAASGATARVYRARDRQSREPVALKLLQTAAAPSLSALAREALALATLRIPGVARYVAHGATAGGRLYLAMEWLDGETLSDRLARAPLTVAESLTLAACVAETLAAVHRLGFVHCDVKPENLILQGGALSRVKLIDFGVARLSGAAGEEETPAPGEIRGTPQYMAPEQARGELEIDARADVFALGSVLFECLTGRAPFEGSDPLSVLMRVLLEEPPRVRELRDDVPAAVDRLVARMLSKAREGRPRDGGAVAAELAVAVATELAVAIASDLSGEAWADLSGDAWADLSGETWAELAAEALEPHLHPGAPPSSLPPGAREITTRERKVMCLLLAREGQADADATLSAAEGEDRSRAIRELVARHHGRIELLEARWLLVTLSGSAEPTDLAAQAARCALSLRELLGAARLSLVTGRAELAARLPVGAVIDRLVQLAQGGRDPLRPAAIRIDDMTAGLLGARFDTTHDASGCWLHGAREEPETPPSLLGRPTPYLGRARELELLEAEIARCLRGPRAGAVLVTGAVGAGKSRLCYELRRALRARGEPVQVWIGQADPMSAGSAFGLLQRALRRGLGLHDGEPLASRQRKIRARVERRCGAAAAARVAPFLGELAGAPFPDDDDVQLKAARRRPQLMSDQLRLAWEDFLDAECAREPVLLVLDDLHWGDLPTVALVEAALRNLKGRPLAVLALARPSVHELFPGLWGAHLSREIRLPPLSPADGERLVREALGPGASAGLVRTLVERADGNPFCLEEQIRAAARGRTSSPPETVLAVVQAGLDALDPEARRVLRAASVFGEAFTAAGAAALVGRAEVARELDELARREAIVRLGEGGAAGDAAYRFRHALLREAAYGMLTEGDRRLGHALAGGFLAQRGEADPMALAEHFERGGEPARAATAYLAAARQALRGNDLGAVIARAARGVACDPAPATVGELCLLESQAHFWRGDLALAEERAERAAEHLAPGSAAWFSALTQIVVAAGPAGGHDRVERWARLARDTAASIEEGGAAKSICLSSAALMLVFGGRYALADALIEGAERALPGAPPLDLDAVANLHEARAIRAHAHGDPGASLAGIEAALAAFEQAGDVRRACMARMNLGYSYGQAGQLEAAEAALRQALAESERMELHGTTAYVLQNLGLVLAHRGRLDEARSAEETACAMLARHGDVRMEGCARIYLARILLLAGDPGAAEREARAADALLERAPPMRAYAVAVLGGALLDQGRAGDALAAAERARALLDEVGVEEGEEVVRLVHAEALAACGRRAEAARAIADARARLLARAAKISDPAFRARFLESAADSARTLALARSWLGEPAG